MMTRILCLKSGEAQAATKQHIFAADLMRMYLRYAEKVGWKTEFSVLLTPTSAAGISEVVISVQGDAVYSKLKYESGVHRFREYL